MADDRVHVLDPCCGTGAYLAEVLRRIDDTLVTRGLGGLRGQQVKQAALSRIYGFELLPAPFVIAHLQVGRLLQQLQAPLVGDERAQVYLTNALTDWTPTDLERQFEAYPEFEQERELAREVKRERPILVVLGNPPYNGYAGAAIAEERNLVEPYRQVGAWLAPMCVPEGHGLNDLYVRFFRMAERKIVDGSGRGVICFITNFRWLDGSSHPGMRERFLRTFDGIRIDCLNGDKFRNGKLTPDGRPDPSIFSTAYNREGIKVGTAITTLIRKGRPDGRADVGFRHLWGQGKWQELISTTDTPAHEIYEPIEPIPQLCIPFRPGLVADGYFQWPRIVDLFPTSFAGVKTSRDEFLVSIDQQTLRDRLADYFDRTLKHEEIRRRYPSVMAATQRYDAEGVRDELRRHDSQPSEVVRYAYRPFDVRWLCWVGKTKLLDERRSEYRPQAFEGNKAILLPQRHRRSWSEPQVTSRLSDINILDGSCTVFPLLLTEAHESSGHCQGERRPNLTRSAHEYLCQRGSDPIDLFRHTVATLHSTTYSEENASALQMDWPRLPMPEHGELLRTSAALGETLIRLLDPETPVPGVTAGAIRPELAVVAVPTKHGSGGFGAADMAVAANWGYRARNGAIMPGGGSAEERAYTAAERAALLIDTANFGLDSGRPTELLGASTMDVRLNGNAYWANVPKRVWEYRLGGYQVLKKWLSYREERVLGRPLQFAEVLHFTQIARRIAAILLMSQQLNASYCWVRDSAVAWPLR